MLIKYLRIHSTLGGIPVCGSFEHSGGGEGFDQQRLECWEGEKARQQWEENEVRRKRLKMRMKVRLRMMEGLIMVMTFRWEWWWVFFWQGGDAVSSQVSLEFAMIKKVQIYKREKKVKSRKRWRCLIAPNSSYLWAELREAYLPCFDKCSDAIEILNTITIRRMFSIADSSAICIAPASKWWGCNTQKTGLSESICELWIYFVKHISVKC